MQTALYLIPVTLDDTPLSDVIPARTIELLQTIKHYIVENRRSAVRFLVKAEAKIDIDSLTFFELTEHTDLSSIEHYLEPLAQGKPQLLPSPTEEISQSFRLQGRLHSSWA